MTDNVYITGAQSGAFVDAFAGLPPWATNATVEDVKNLINKSNSIQAQVLSTLAKSLTREGLSPEDLKEINDELTKYRKNLIEVDKEFPKEKKRWKDTEDNAKASKKSFGGLFTSMSSLLGITWTLSAAYSAVLNVMLGSIDTFDKLHESGVNMVGGLNGASNGFEALQQLTTITGVRFEELAKTMAKYSTSVNNFGAAKFAKTMASAAVELRQFGFTTQETGDLLGTYLDAQRAYTNSNNKTQQETQQDLVKFGKNINNLSMATGMAKGKILEHYDALTKTVDANILFSKTGKAAAENTLEFIASMKDQQLGKEFLAMMTDTVKPLNSTFMALQKSGNGAFAKKEQDFIKSLEGLDPEEQKKRLAEFGKASEPEIRKMIQRNKILEQAGNAEAKATNEHLNRLLQESKAYNEMTDEDRKKVAATAEATKKIKNSWERFQSTLQRLIAPTIPLLDALSTALDGVGYIVDSIYGFLSWFASGVKEGLTAAWDAVMWVLTPLRWMGEQLSKMMPSVSGFGEGVSKIASFTTGLLGSIALIAGAFYLFGSQIKTAISVFKSLITGDFKSAKDAIFKNKASNAAPDIDGPSGKGGKGGKGSKGGIASSIGKGMADIGKGIGSFLSSVGKGAGAAIKAVLKGLASGLSALGKPQVLLGVAAVGLIGASLWVAGKAFQEFTNIEWGQVAIGIGVIAGLAGVFTLLGPAITAALPFIAGGALAIGAIGASMWVAGKGMQAVGDGIDKLAEGVIKLSNIKGTDLMSTALGITAISGAMAAFGAGSLVGGIGAAMGDILGKLFGGSIIDQLKDFANMGTPLQNAANALMSITDGFTILSNVVDAFDIDTLHEIVDTINDIDILKAAAFSVINSFGTPTAATKNNATTNPASDLTTPKTSSINSPSTSDETVETEAPSAPVMDEPLKTAGGIKQPSSGSDINTAIAFQSSLLEQLLLSTNNLVSINKDILRATKNQT